MTRSLGSSLTASKRREIRQPSTAVAVDEITAGGLDFEAPAETLRACGVFAGRWIALRGAEGGERRFVVRAALSSDGRCRVSDSVAANLETPTDFKSTSTLHISPCDDFATSPEGRPLPSASQLPPVARRVKTARVLAHESSAVEDYSKHVAARFQDPSRPSNLVYRGFVFGVGVPGVYFKVVECVPDQLVWVDSATTALELAGSCDAARVPSLALLDPSACSRRALEETTRALSPCLTTGRLHVGVLLHGPRGSRKRGRSF